ncbi:MAG: tetratricopeptide repeat protein [Anaerolineales bacterium]|nr:tetratricopeptide repeat protein [Anaerolineales bacterium]
MMDRENKSGMTLPDLPEGTVTFVFTDIEGSTKLLKQLGNQYATVLADQRRILRDIFSRWNGQEVDTQGDSFFVSFPRATEAVAAAVDLQRELYKHTWPENAEVRVRVGIHTGEPLVVEEGYVGFDVHRAARIGSVGHGGQVLLSETTATLVIDDLPEGVGLMDLGKHQLKDLRRAERIRQLVIKGLPAEFPPLKSLEAIPPDEFKDQPRHNLPSELTSFIGREEEVNTISDLLRDPSCRLLTLVGVGGIGKTRLALHAAASLVDEYPDGVWLVEFANIRDPDLVPQHAASVLGVSALEAQNGRDVGDVLITYLSDKNLMMVFDNCEHLIRACAGLAESLLRECPEVQLLATSRENLGIPGEKSFAVQSMGVPPERVPQGDLENYEAARLFVDRAGNAAPGFQLTSTNSSSVINICRHLDGIPLAIELAAARVKIIAPEQIADRLQDRFELLAGGPRTALPRHQTLQATMEWSYDLLTEPEKDLFMRLSVFSGGWSLEHAESLVRDDVGGRTNVLDVLSNLVDKSLVIVEHRRGMARCGMLETVNQFASDKLFRSGDAEDFCQRHANFFINLAEETDPKIRSADQLMGLELLRVEHENMRAALNWLIDSNQADEAARLVGALGWFWFLGGFWQEAWKWLSKVLNMVEAPKPHLRAKAMFRAGGLELIRGNLSGRLELVEEALEICEDVDDEEGMAWCLNLLGQATTFHKQDLDKGAEILSESIELFRKLGDEWGVAWSTRYLGQIFEIQGDADRAIQLQREALQDFEDLGDIWNTAHSLYLLGGTLCDYGDLDESRILYEESLLNCKLVEDDVMAAHALQGLGILALTTEHYRDAGEHLSESLEIMQRIGDENCASRILANMSKIAMHDSDLDKALVLQQQSLHGFMNLKRKDAITMSFARLASLAQAIGSDVRAARLLGAAEAYRNQFEVVLAPVNLEEYEKIVSEFQVFRGDEVIDESYEDGYNMSYDQAIAYALGEIEDI